MARSVPPQVIRRPENWRLGELPPWAGVPPSQRRWIGVSRVVDSLATHGQLGVKTDWPSVDSAVLLILFEEAGEARLVLTRRSSALRSHQGQVSFPGGRIDPGEDPISAALREAHEEVSLDLADVTTLGWMQPTLTPRLQSFIAPIVASVPTRPDLVPSPAEVARVFDVALRDLADPDIFHEEHWHVPGLASLDRPDGVIRVPFFEIEGEIIWGATARILRELLSVVLSSAAEVAVCSSAAEVARRGERNE